MDRVFNLPPDYTVRDVRDREDVWLVYNLLVLKREKEPSKSLEKSIIHNQLFPFISLTIFCLIFILLSRKVLNISDELSYFLAGHILLYSLLFGLLFLGFLQLMLFFSLFSKGRKRMAIALYRDRVAGVAQLAFREKHSVLLGLYVAPSHRRRGVGSYLVWYILHEDALPIYLLTLPQLHSFYNRFGFIKSNKRRGYNMVLRVLK